MKKLVRDLQPGDILQVFDGPPEDSIKNRAVVLRWNSPARKEDGMLLAYLDRPTARASLWTERYFALDSFVDVEAPELTPAQQHADELSRRLKWALGFIETYAHNTGPATPELNKVRAVLAIVEPPVPPTLAEALAALKAVMTRPALTEPRAARQAVNAAADGILERARASGLI